MKLSALLTIVSGVLTGLLYAVGFEKIAMGMLLVTFLFSVTPTFSRRIDLQKVTETVLSRISSKNSK